MAVLWRFNVNTTWTRDAAGVGGLLRNHNEEVILAFPQKLTGSLSAKHDEIIGISLYNFFCRLN